MRIKWDAKNRNNKARLKKAELIDLPRAKGCIMTDHYAAQQIHRNYGGIFRISSIFLMQFHGKQSTDVNGKYAVSEIQLVKARILVESRKLKTKIQT